MEIWKARRRRRSPKYQCSKHNNKPVNEGGGIKNTQNPVNVVYGCPIIYYREKLRLMNFQKCRQNFCSIAVIVEFVELVDIITLFWKCKPSPRKLKKDTQIQNQMWFFWLKIAFFFKFNKKWSYFLDQFWNWSKVRGLNITLPE